MKYSNFNLIRSLYLVFIFITTTLSVGGQINLVPNPSFETFLWCPYALGDINYTGNWSQPTFATTDFYHSCYIPVDTSMLAYDNVSTPKNVLGYQKPYNNGEGYAGLVIFEGNANGPQWEWKEYARTSLNFSLNPGQKYYCSFYVSLANESKYATDVISAFFSKAAVGSFSTTNHLAVVPQISSPAGNFLTDTLNWMQVSGQFIANGGEQYITIGVFKSKENTATITVNPSGRFDQAYYYIDEICLSTNPTTCKVSADVGLNKETFDNSMFYYSPLSQSLILKGSMDNFNLLVTDVYGKNVFSSELSGKDSIDLSGLSSGCYFTYLTNSRSVYVKKILIN